MVTFKRSHSTALAMIKPALVTLILVYLVFHTFGGNHGVYAYLKEQRKTEVSTAKLEVLAQKRQGLEKNVSLLGDTALDVDLLDERVRGALGYVHRGETVYLFPVNE